MKCIYCHKPVFGGHGMTVSNFGPAHRSCHQAKEAMKRTFKHLDLSELTDEELSELQELLQAECNHRKLKDSPEDRVELF